jgi:hypothetical protein
MANIFVAATATWNGKALKKAKQDVDVFSKQIKGLARTFGVAFSAAALVSFGKKAVKVFTEDEAAAKRLALQLENTGNAFRVDEVEGYIKSLEKTNAILTDLRAPFQTLLNLTGSVALAQRSLESALNISAGTGENLNTVVSAISSGIRGQTKAIKNLNTGIDANIIATGDMNAIMEALDKRFSGQSAARLDTYAGKMDVLAKGADEATKAIGVGIVGALTALSEDNSIEKAALDMENYGVSIGNAIAGLGTLAADVKKLPGARTVTDVLFGTNIFSMLGKYFELDQKEKAKDDPALNKANIRESRLGLKFNKEVVKYNKILADQLKKKTEVDKLAEKFDVERIGLMKALGEATDAETKLRLQSKLAILDNNEALSKKYLAEMNAVKGANDLALAFGAAVLSLSSTNADIAKYQNDLAALQDKQIKAGTTVTAPNPADTAIVLSTARSTLDRLQESLPKLLERVQAGAATFDRSDTYIPSSAMPSGVPTTTTAPVINVNVEGSLTSLQEFEITMQDLLLKIYKQNGDLAPAGFIQ